MLDNRIKSVENGLAQNSILSIIQDRTGYLWICTEDGLHRFDGSTFKKFRAIPGDSTGLPDNVIWSLLEDDKGRIWIGHSKGISYLDPSDRQFQNIKVVNKS